MSELQSIVQTSSSQPSVIYALIDPVTNKIRYIGKTSCGPDQRLFGHYCDAKRKRRTPTHLWILGLQQKPRVVVIETIPEGANWQHRERRWIRRMTEHGIAVRRCQAEISRFPLFEHPDKKQREFVLT